MLVIPREHAWWEGRATESYRVVHECLAQALRELGQAATVKKQRMRQHPPPLADRI